MSNVITAVETVTPKTASQYLAQNHPDNRPIRQARVKQWMDALREGRWVLTHQGIAFDEMDRLIDGQHRLTAIVMSGVPAKMSVTRGLSLQSFAVLDQGAFRNAADILRLKTWQVAALRCQVGLETYAPTYSQSIRTVDLEARMATGGLVEIMHLKQLATATKNSVKFQSSPVLGALAFAYPVAPTHVDSFFIQVVTGELLERNDPAYRLREWLNNNDRTSGRLGWQAMLAVLQAFHHCIIKGRGKIENLIVGESGYRLICTQRRNMRLENTPNNKEVPAISPPVRDGLRDGSGA